MAFGVDETGFIKKTLQEILDSIEESERSKINSGLNLTSTSVLGQINGIVADQLRDLWDIAQAVYASQYPDTASGSSLDNLASLTGIFRLAEAPSTVELTLNVGAGVVVPKGTIVSSSSSGVRFKTSQSVTGASFPSNVKVPAESEDNGPIVAPATTLDTIETPINGLEASVSVITDTAAILVIPNPSESYSLDGKTLIIAVDGVIQPTLTFTSSALASPEVTPFEVAALISTIDNITATTVDSDKKVRIQHDSDDPGNSIEIIGGTSHSILNFEEGVLSRKKVARIAGPYSLNGLDLSVSVNGGLSETVTFSATHTSASSVASRIKEVVKSVDTSVEDNKVVITSSLEIGGTIEITGGTAEEKFDFPHGIHKGFNFKSADPGRFLETDSELRFRRLQSLSVRGAGSVDAIRSGVAALAGVSEVQVFENVSDVVVSGRPPHSFETIVQGGDEQTIAEKIFELKPAGIQAYGAITRNVIDSQLFSHSIGLTRPSLVSIHIQVIIKADSSKFPENGESLIKNAILELGDNQNLGESLVSVKYECAVVDSVGGLLDLTYFTFSLTDLPLPVSPGIPSGNISLDPDQLAVFSVDDIDVKVEF